jgi:toluene monooxygenase system protein E
VNTPLVRSFRERSPGHRRELQLPRREPSEYEVTSLGLLHVPQRGFEVHTPSSEWQSRHRTSDRLACDDWDRFRDPRATTYTKYTELQRSKDDYVDRLLASIEVTDYDRRLSPAWLAMLDRVFGPLRYPVHGLQMLASYLGALAPSGPLVIAGLLQSADETRRVERLAQRLCQLQRVHPGCGRASRRDWEHEPGWQPMRELIEQLLAVYTWGEAFVAVNVVLKPAFDELFMLDFGRLAQATGDDVLERMLRALHEDCAWHRQWSAALIAMLVQNDAANARTMAGWVERWKPRTDAAIDAVIEMLERQLVDHERPDGPAVRSSLDQFMTGYWASLGLALAHEPIAGKAAP